MPEDSYIEKPEKTVQEAGKTGNGRCRTSSGCPFGTDRNGVEKESMTLSMRDQEDVEKGEELIHLRASMTGQSISSVLPCLKE